MAELAKVLITKTILGSNQTTVTFSNIPSSYTSLQLIFSARSTNTTAMKSLTGNNASMRYIFNGNLTSNTNAGSNFYISYGTDVYTNYTYAARKTSFSTYFGMSGPILTDGDAANMFSTGTMTMFNYSKTNQNKMYMGNVVGFGTTEGYNTKDTGSMATTSAISQIDINLISGSSIKAGSSFSLYGILTA